MNNIKLAQIAYRKFRVKMLCLESLQVNLWNLECIKVNFIKYFFGEKDNIESVSKKTPFFIKQFLHTFCQKRTFSYPTTFFESLITQKRSIFEESYISYSKRQKSCTLIVI